VKFWRDAPGPNYKGNKTPDWACHIGKNLVESCGGFGPTPLEALMFFELGGLSLEGSH
jgi:hypothetical protein